MWQAVDGQQLFDDYMAFSNLLDSLPSTPGIYMWKPNLTHKLLKFDSAGILERLARTLEMNHATASSGRIGHSVMASSIQFRGDGLKEPKKSTLMEALADADVRVFMLSFLDSVSPHCPSLYVGEGDDLADRVKAHVSGASDFAKRLQAESDWTIQELSLHFLELPDTTKDFRQALEAYVSVLTGAWLVRRAG